MKIKRKMIIISLVIGCGYFIWSLRPVKIIRAEIQYEYDPVFQNGLFNLSERGFTDDQNYDIAVDHMPLTEWGRIQWYLEHKAELKERYRIPGTSSYSIAFWEAAGGFIDGDKSGDGDLICFNKTESKKDCLEKSLLLSVYFEEGEQERFTFSDCNYYWTVNQTGRLALYRQ